jgi:hypothetical protein
VIRARIARLFGRFVWEKPRRAARLLESFELAEASSMLDLVAAARDTPSPARRALYLAHALDEDRHARTFSARARELRKLAGMSSIAPRQADFDALYARLGELDFLAFVHRGEVRGHAQFVGHREELARRGDERGVSLFDAILVDEARHASYSGVLLRELAGSEKHARKALRRAAFREALWAWRRAGRFIAGILFTLLSTLLYLLLAPAALAYRALRRAPRGWLPPEAR